MSAGPVGSAVIRLAHGRASKMTSKKTHGFIDEAMRSAIGLLAQHGIAPSPPNYAVYFGYCLGRNQALVHDVKALLSEATPPSEARIQEIHDRHLGPEGEAGEIRETGRKISVTVSDILESLRQAGRDQSAFGAKLEGFSGQLTEEISPAQATMLVQGMLRETQQIMAQNEALESRLSESTQEIDDLRQHLAEVQREAMTDALTGIPNRKFFDQTLLEEIASAEAEGTELCLLLADIDHFKKFNDTYGQRVGDEVLKVVAHTLKDGIKGRDTSARYGGEEFAVILPRTTLENAATVAEEIRSTLAHRKLQNRRKGNSYGKVTLSIGVARYRPGESVGSFVERADAALYRAKSGGRNRVEAETLEEQVSGLRG
jgi:diguanylate cyclase